MRAQARDRQPFAEEIRQIRPDEGETMIVIRCRLASAHLLLIDKAIRAKSQTARDLFWWAADLATGWTLAPTDQGTLEAILVSLRKMAEAAEIIEPIELTGRIGNET